MVDTSEWIEVLFCQDCALVIANGDFSGIEDPEAHGTKMDAALYGFCATVHEGADLGFHEDTCAGCGEHTATDQWFSGWLEPVV